MYGHSVLNLAKCIEMVIFSKRPGSGTASLHLGQIKASFISVNCLR